MRIKLINEYWWDSTTLLGWDTDRFDFPQAKWYFEKTGLGGIITFDDYIKGLLTDYLPSFLASYQALAWAQKADVAGVVETLFAKNSERSLAYWDKSEFERAMAVYIGSNFRAIEKWSTDLLKGFSDLTKAELTTITTKASSSSDGNLTSLIKFNDTPQGAVTAITDGYLTSLTDNKSDNSQVTSNDQTSTQVDPNKIVAYYQSIKSMFEYYADKGKYLFSSFE